MLKFMDGDQPRNFYLDNNDKPSQDPPKPIQFLSVSKTSHKRPNIHSEEPGWPCLQLAQQIRGYHTRNARRVTSNTTQTPQTPRHPFAFVTRSLDSRKETQETTCCEEHLCCDWTRAAAENGAPREERDESGPRPMLVSAILTWSEKTNVENAGELFPLRSVHKHPQSGFCSSSNGRGGPTSWLSHRREARKVVLLFVFRPVLRTIHVQHLEPVDHGI